MKHLSQNNMKYRWIYETIVNSNGKSYTNYVVYIKDEYKYSSRVLANCESYVLNYARKHEIEEKKILKNGKHPRI